MVVMHEMDMSVRYSISPYYYTPLHPFTTLPPKPSQPLLTLSNSTLNDTKHLAQVLKQDIRKGDIVCLWGYVPYPIQRVTRSTSRKSVNSPVVFISYHVFITSDVGTGKTYFISSFIRSFTNMQSLHVPSPTFIIQMTYEHKGLKYVNNTYASLLMYYAWSEHDQSESMIDKHVYNCARFTLQGS